MYRQLASYYDEIYHFKDYQKEAQKIETLIQQHKKSPGDHLLDVACGTGNHIAYLKQRYNVEGLDFSSEMLRIARKKHPDVVFHQGDMTRFKLNTRFDSTSLTENRWVFGLTKNILRRSAMQAWRSASTARV